MTDGFVSGVELLSVRENKRLLSTGSSGIDELIGGGVASGMFYLFYGDADAVDHMTHQLLVNTLLGRNSSAESVYLNCGNYREEKTIFNAQLAAKLMKAANLDPLEALDRITVFCAFSEEQQEQVVNEVTEKIQNDGKVRTLVVHDIAKLFTSKGNKLDKERRKRINHLQHVVLRLWQTCAERDVAFIASCRAARYRKGSIPKPEGGLYLSHEANVILYLRKLDEKNSVLQAFLAKHPSIPQKAINFSYEKDECDDGTRTFKTAFHEELRSLINNYRAALVDPARREAFDVIMKAWTGEEEAMSYAKVPTVLDVMLLTAIVDNRRSIEDLTAQVSRLKEGVLKLKERLPRV